MSRKEGDQLSVKVVINEGLVFKTGVWEAEPSRRQNIL